MNKNIPHLQNNVETALNQKRIKDALSILNQLALNNHKGMLNDELYNLEFAYKSMLKYTFDGVSDPEQQQVYNNIIKSCYDLSDALFASINNSKSNNIFYETQRNLQLNNQISVVSVIEEFFAEHAKNQITAQNEISSQYSLEISGILFNHLWATSNISDDEYKRILELIVDHNIHFSYRCIFISAITIGLFQEFNENKILLLFNALQSNEDVILQRTLTGLLLVLFKYDSRLFVYPKIKSRLTLLQEDKRLIKNILSIAIQLIRTRETEKISTKLNEEILPEVVKMQPNLRNKLDLDNLLGEKLNEGENPEWEDFFKDSPELMNKLEELTELQLEGADVFLTTFKMLKHFSFFNSVYNWFTPFYLENPELKKALGNEDNIFSNKKIQESLANSGFLCNSDKYSLFLSIPHMPPFQKDMMGKMFEQQMEQMDEIEKDEKIISPEKKQSIISNRYIQDLYRFFKIHPQHHQFEDIFAWKMDFHNKTFFTYIIEDIDSLRQIAEFFFKKEYFNEAAEAFEIINKKQIDNIEIIQKLAYCYQQNKTYKKALKQYLKADILKPEQIWTTKKIALMYKLLRQPEKALEYYLIAERLKPKDLYTQASIGHCHLDLKNYTDALKYYFKVEYLDESNTKVWRPIAWCSFVVGNLKQAEKYYNKLLLTSSNTHDIINIAHVFWCQNNRREALKFYQKAISKMNNNFTEFFEVFNEDIPYLTKNGILKEDIPFIIDQLKYNIEG
ncbi:tetratricopeptide repeat protein [Plebeiibacterium marinum]|uniref:Tetratricopeptide repeat protein n=1 Tax=Plebeiibacterium marinum TaxID=2992111 RepID=A0AAE3SLC1_9BACT|nr:hypothetical protein [Plebeiobacterium marinum]MCW3807294.1 hypothetical protein [Plebeiobacterium marinum]